MTAVRLPADPQPIIDWLKTLPPDAPCGVKGKTTVCTLANWLRTQGASDPVVGDAMYWTRYDQSKAQFTPFWAHNFIHQSDGDRPAEWGEPITAAEALDILTALKGAQE